MGSCRARSIYLTTRLLGRFSPLRGCPVLCTFFRQNSRSTRNWQLPFLNQRKGENDRRKYFMINVHERMLPTLVGVEPATSWSPVRRRIQLSHRGRLQHLSWSMRQPSDICPMKTQISLHICAVWSVFIVCMKKLCLLYLPLSKICPVKIWPQGYKTSSCSTQLSMKFSLLINMTMPTIVGIFHIY